MKKNFIAALAAGLFMSGLATAAPMTLVSQGLNDEAYTADNARSGYSASAAFDGNFETSWNAAHSASGPIGRTGWIEVNLGRITDITRILLNVEQAPSPLNTRHEIWLSNSSIQEDTAEALLAHAFSGSTSNSDTLIYDLSAPAQAQYIQIRTTESLSWVAWNEIQVFASTPVPEPSTAWLLGLGMAAIGGIRHKKAQRQHDGHKAAQ